MHLFPSLGLQVISNGITNALKYTHSGSVVVQATLERLKVPKGSADIAIPHVLFQVIDTGAGLNGMDYRNLFDPMSTSGERC